MCRKKKAGSHVHDGRRNQKRKPATVHKISPQGSLSITVFKIDATNISVRKTKEKCLHIISIQQKCNREICNHFGPNGITHPGQPNLPTVHHHVQHHHTFTPDPPRPRLASPQVRSITCSVAPRICPDQQPQVQTKPRQATSLSPNGDVVAVVVCVCVCFVLFCFVLFCFVLFCFVLFCFVLFCFVLFCFVLFCFVLFVCFGFYFVCFDT